MGIPTDLFLLNIRYTNCLNLMSSSTLVAECDLTFHSVRAICALRRLNAILDLVGSSQIFQSMDIRPEHAVLPTYVNVCLLWPVSTLFQRWKHGAEKRAERWLCPFRTDFTNASGQPAHSWLSLVVVGLCGTNVIDERFVREYRPYSCV